MAEAKIAPNNVSSVLAVEALQILHKLVIE